MKCIPLFKTTAKHGTHTCTAHNTLEHQNTHQHLQKNMIVTPLKLLHEFLAVDLPDCLVLSVHLIFRLPSERPPSSGWGRRVGQRGSREFSDSPESSSPTRPESRLTPAPIPRTSYDVRRDVLTSCPQLLRRRENGMAGDGNTWLP